MAEGHRETFAQVLTAELDEIQTRRQAPSKEACEPTVSPDEREVQRQALKMDLTGLALSGGGIRSATFALGVLQGLASFGLLRRFDYLSTVSGGGYIGSWLAAWIKREGDISNVEQQLKPKRLEQAKGRVLHPGPPSDQEPEPIAHLRAYTSYLAPRRGLLSADSFVLVAIYLRNILLNQLVLFPACVAVLLLPRLLEPFYLAWESDFWERIIRNVMLAALFFAVVFITIQAVAARRWRRDPASKSMRVQEGVRLFQGTIIFPLLLFALLISRDLAWDLARGTPAQYAGAVGLGSTPPGPFLVVPATLTSYDILARRKLAEWHLGTYQEGELREPSGYPLAVAVLLFGVALGIVVTAAYLLLRLLQFGIRLVQCIVDLIRPSPRQGTSPLWQPLRDWLPGEVVSVLSSFLAGSTGGALFFLVFAVALRRVYERAYDAALVATLGPPLAVLVLVASAAIAVGVMGTFLDESRREWWASLGGWLLIYAVAWPVVVGISLFGPLLLMKAGTWGQAILGSGWAATAWAGLLAGRSPRTAGQGSRGLELLAKIGPPVFLIGFLALVALAIDWAQGNLPPSDGSLTEYYQTPDRLQDSSGQWSPSDGSLTEYFQSRSEMSSWVLLGTILGCAGFAFVVALRVDVNAFSEHGMYADRLTRCYLGASRPKKKEEIDRPTGAPTNSKASIRYPDPVTGFDPEDDLPLWRLRMGADATDTKTPYQGPYPLINTAMNLVQGDELAWQERKAESFVLGPRYCGSLSTGYRRLRPEDPDPLRLGTAIALSGAAVSPNMGYHSSPAVTFLLTIFNVRLGGWIGNPRHGTPGNDGPWQGLLYFLKELFGRTNDRAAYVYLSDGGHFDNLGVYELVRRRCRYIVVCDAEQDADYTFDALGAVIQKCQSDFGVRIEIDVSPIQPQGEARRSRWHCAIGKIHYDDVQPEAVEGILVYLKASLTGDEPADLQTYAREHPSFPHLSTVDQFFTETQFESYRGLGLHIAREVFRDVVWDLNNPADRSNSVQQRVVNKLFSNLHARWFPPPPDFDKSFLQSVQGYNDIMEALRTDKHLQEFSRSLYPELNANSAPARQPEDEPAEVRQARRRAELHLVGQMLQVMEDVWLSLNIEGYFAHPMYRGWMNTFRRWTSSPKFRRYWSALRGEFSKDFVRFCETELSLKSGGVRVERLAPSPQWLAESAPAEADPARESLRLVLRRFCDTFHYEWPQEERLESRIGKAWQDAAGFGNVWLLRSLPSDGQPTDSHSADGEPCGIMLTWKPNPDRKEFELLVWMLGPYRDLGVGRASLEEVFRQLGSEPRYQEYALRARYPRGALQDRDIASGEDQDMAPGAAIWRTFHTFYGFRPVVPRPGEEGYFILAAPPEEWRRFLG